MVLTLHICNTFLKPKYLRASNLIKKNSNLHIYNLQQISYLLIAKHALKVIVQDRTRSSAVDINDVIL